MKSKLSEKYSGEYKQSSLLSKSIKNVLAESGQGNRYSQQADQKKAPPASYTSKNLGGLLRGSKADSGILGNVSRNSAVQSPFQRSRDQSENENKHKRNSTKKITTQYGGFNVSNPKQTSISRKSVESKEFIDSKKPSARDSYNLLSLSKKDQQNDNTSKLPANLSRNSRRSTSKEDKSTDNLSRKSSSKQRLITQEYSLNQSWLGSKENLGAHTQKTPSCKLDLSRYAKSKNATPIQSHRANKASSGSLEVKEIERIPTLHDRFEKRKETSELMVSQLSKYDINNDRINSFRNRCKEYDKLGHTKSISQVDDINATRKNIGTSDNENSEIKIAQNLSRTKMKNSGSDRSAPRELNISDLQFLFSKKLSNVDKLSLLKMKKVKEEPLSSRVKEEPRETPNSEYTYSNILDRKTSARGSGTNSNYRDSQKPQELSASNFYQASRERPNSSSKDSAQQDSHITLITSRREAPPAPSKNIIIYQKSQREREIEELVKDPARGDKEERQKRIRELENRFKNKRGSMPEETEADKLAKEFDFTLDMKKVSMTPDISRKGSLEPLPGRRDPQRKDLDLNSRLILNTLISEVGKTEEQYMESLEFERRNLIEYIGSTIKSTGKVPKTTLQFYKILKMIGKGSFGKVHLSIHILSKKKVAIKCIDKTYIKEEKSQKKIVQEVKILRSLVHRNIIRILEVFENKKFVFIVTDYASRGDLLKYMKEHGVFKEHRAKPIVAQILKSLEYCHAKKVLHRDIKLDNILLDKDMQVKLCDFGVSRFMSDEVIKERCGTPAYIAPEIINGLGYSMFQADVWSLGVLMYALTTGTIPFKAKNIPDLHKLILKNDFDFPEGVDLSSAFKNLIRLMLIKDPEQRITIDEVWSHKWLEGFTHQRTKQTHTEIDEYVLEQVYVKMEKLGIPRIKTIESIQNQQMNHISATFYLYTRKLI